MKASGAMDFKELFDNALFDITRACQTVSGVDSDISKKILVSLKNTMSDRHVVDLTSY